MAQGAQLAAQQVLDVVPVMMSTIRAYLPERRTSDINLLQFRTMAYLNRNRGASLSDLAAHIGLTPPAMSKLIDGLVDRDLVSRKAHSGDRRRICLSLTTQGRDKLNAAYKHTQEFLADDLSSLAEGDLETIFQAMQILRKLFLPDRVEESIRAEK